MSILENTTRSQDSYIDAGNTFSPLETTPNDAEDLILGLVSVAEDLDQQIEDLKDENEKRIEAIEDLKDENEKRIEALELQVASLQAKIDVDLSGEDI